MATTSNATKLTAGADIFDPINQLGGGSADGLAGFDILDATAGVSNGVSDFLSQWVPTFNADGSVGFGLSGPSGFTVKNFEQLQYRTRIGGVTSAVISVDIAIYVKTFSPDITHPTNVSVNSPIVLTFNESVKLGASGLIVLHSGDPAGTNAVVASSSAISGTNLDTLTITPSSALTAGTHYYVTLAKDAVLSTTVSNKHVFMGDGSTNAGVVPLYDFTTAQAQPGVDVATFLLTPSVANAIDDTAANIANNLDALETNYLNIISLTQSLPGALTITATQLSADTHALALLNSGTYTLMVTGVTATNAATVFANSHVSSFTVSDTSSTIANSLDILQANIAKISSIHISDSIPVSINTTQATNDAAVLALITNGGGSYVVDTSNIAPTLTTFSSSVTSGIENTQINISFDNLKANSDANDVDGTVTAFNIKSVSSGALLIGTDASSALPWNATTNFMIDATHHAFWTPDLNANGVTNAFTAVAKDNAGLESTTPINASVHVYHKISGTANSEKLIGTVADDLIDAVIGKDTLTGGLGADNYLIESGDDVIKDLGYGGDGNLYVASGASVIATLAGDFVASKTSGNDGIASILDIANNNVNLSLATGINGFTVNASKSTSGISLITTSNADTILGSKGNDTILSGDGDDSINGAEGNDSILGGLGNDLLNGGKGDDTLVGGAGSNILTGGAGIDTFITDANASDTITDLSLDDLLTVGANATVTATALKGWLANASTVNNGSLIINTLGPVNVSTVTGSGSIIINNVSPKNLTLTGGSQPTQIVGGIGKDILIAGNSQTTLTGGLGDDTYIVNNTNVVINEGTDAPIKGDLVKSSINYALDANVENLTLTGNIANLATGNQLNNILIANNVGDTLDGGIGSDTLIGGSGDDTFMIDSPTDVVIDKLGGTDTVISSISYVLGATIENLTLTGTNAINGTGNKLINVITGNDGDNILTAGAGNATIIGGLGNDTITGGKGVNTLTGGDGNDSFVFGKGNGLTTITDFVSGSDHLNISATAFKGLTPGILDKAYFVANTKGQADIGNIQQHFIYNTDNGTLYFDADGGGIKSSPVSIEVLGTSSHPTLLANDITIV